MDLSWMAWTWQTALFFGVIGTLLGVMTVWELWRPGGAPRRGLFRIETTRGDRLFIALLGSAFIYLAWLGLFGSHLWIPSAIVLAYAACIFRWV